MLLHYLPKNGSLESSFSHFLNTKPLNIWIMLTFLILTNINFLLDFFFFFNHVSVQRKLLS